MRAAWAVVNTPSLSESSLIAAMLLKYFMLQL